MRRVVPGSQHAGGGRGWGRGRGRAHHMLVLCLEAGESGRGVGRGVVVRRGGGRRRGRGQVVGSRRGVDVRPGGDGVNGSHDVRLCRRVLLVGAGLLHEVRAWSGRGRGRRRGHSSSRLVVNWGVLGGQKVARSHVVARNGLLAGGAWKCLIWS